MKILALAATNHKPSINQALLNYALELMGPKHEVKQIDLKALDLPLLDPVIEEESGIPEGAQKFVDLIDWADLVIISYAEYNGSYTPVYKNLLDWASRVRQSLWNDTNLFFMATSPGRRGAQTVLKAAADYAPFMGGNVVGTFSFPSFNQNFADERIVDETLAAQLQKKLEAATETISAPTKDTRWIRFLKALSGVWNLTGWTTFIGIAVSGFVGSALLFSPYVAILWPIALYAATFTLIIRPIYDFFPHSRTLEVMLEWRKGIGLISSGIVVGFWLNRYFEGFDFSLLAQYFTADRWTDPLSLIARTSEITALILLLISNKWTIKHFNKTWRALQKLSYVYFVSAAAYLVLAFDSTYALACLLVFFTIYQLWIYHQLSVGDDNGSQARKSQSS